jgi:cation transport regulator
MQLASKRTLHALFDKRQLAVCRQASSAAACSDIYRAAFNHALEAHCNDPRREEVAHRIAWAGVKRLYEKSDGFWVRKANPWSNAD